MQRSYQQETLQLHLRALQPQVYLLRLHSLSMGKQRASSLLFPTRGRKNLRSIDRVFYKDGEREMRIIPLSFDSLGTRSMATYVEAKDVKVLIDPGVALAPNRNGRPPHPIEIDLMMKEWKRIKAHANKANVLIVTHYHYDHQWLQF